MSLTIQNQAEIKLGDKTYPAGSFLYFSDIDFTIGETAENLKKTRKSSAYKNTPMV